jgi:ActR/RegA family two-component response regulator
VERAGEIELTDRSFKDNKHLIEIIERILSRVGRHIDESSPLVDALLADGSRVNAIIPPLAIHPCLSIRRFRGTSVALQQVIENKPAQSIEPNESGGLLGISVAVLSEQEERQLLLQRLVQSTQVARVVFGHIGFPLAATDPILRQIREQRAEVVLVDVSPDDPQRAIHTIELIRAATSDVAIFAVGEMRSPNTVVSAMRAGACEFIGRPTTTTDLIEAFIRLSGVRRKAPSDSGPSGGSVPPGGSAPPSGSTPPGVPLGVPRSIRPRTPPLRKMVRRA